MNILYAPFAARPPSGGPSPKSYPYALALAKILTAEGHDVLQVGSNQEPLVAERIERGRSFKEICEMLEEADTFVGVDSYLQHAAWYVNKRGIVIWGPSDPNIFGHECHVNLLKSRGYLRPNQFEMWHQHKADENAFIKPEIVLFHVRRIAEEVASTPKIG